MTYEAFTKLYCFDCKHSTYGELIPEVGADAICMLHNYPCDDVKDCPEFDDTNDDELGD